MKAPIYVVNLSAPPTPRSAVVGKQQRLAPLFRPIETLVNGAPGTQDFAQLSGSAQLGIRGPLILYIVAHAVPDGLIDANGETLNEKAVADAIRATRDEWPTVIVWDVCFAESFFKFSGYEEWGPQYVHIFACQEFERTWQKNGFTQFSEALENALGILPDKNDWDLLEAELQNQLGTLQTPAIVAGVEAGVPTDFF
jgi:hypothetical protein